ncbi:nucleotidyltransferase substrate binding protein (plasmid) [Pseudalkalibacillus hwajinpoensis]|uniref:nucleotidyltransferase substrate binding protein n=1 Tax=Guptibacillus hwajinpoensis TaxID=208199 RepID=UPI00325AFB4D
MNKERLYEKLEDIKGCIPFKIPLTDDIVYDGVIQRFEFTFELSWKTMKMFLGYTGISEIRSQRATIREAFSCGLIENGDDWIDMMIDRNKTSHLYDEEEAKFIYQKVKNTYTKLLNDLITKWKKN